MNADLINGGFELGGALINILSLRALWVHQQVQGVHWAPTFFFFAWGLWNLFYYPHLHQPVSFIGGLALVLMNLAWLTLALGIHLRDHNR